MMAVGVLDWSSSAWLPPPPASPVPLPRKRERKGEIEPPGFLSRLRGRGTSRRLVDGGAPNTGPTFIPVHIPLRGSFVLPSP
jgi:hypothetical protein